MLGYRLLRPLLAMMLLSRLRTDCPPYSCKRLQVSCTHLQNYTIGASLHRSLQLLPVLSVKFLQTPDYLTFVRARCNIYISRLCYDVSVHLSVRLSVRLSVTEVHCRIIANLGFKFRSKFTAHFGCREG